LKARTLATTLLVTIFLIQPFAQFGAVEANPFQFGIQAFSLISPNSNPYLSTKPTVETSFSYRIPISDVQVDYFSYSLDNDIRFTLDSNQTFDYTYNKTKYSVTKTIENLETGIHSITFYAQFLNGINKEIGHLRIVVDPTYKTPIPIVISPLNHTTYANKVPITITVENGTLDYGSIYELDSSLTGKITNFSGNTTLNNLSDGSYKLQLHISVMTLTRVHVGGFSYTVFFDVNNSLTANTPFPSSMQPVKEGFYGVDYKPMVFAIILLVIVAFLGSLIYFRRKNR
jgi:hypothetical protein